MKKTKNYFKFIFSMMVFALLSFVFAFTPIFTALSATAYAAETAMASYNLIINSIKMPNKDVDVSSEKEEERELRIPLLSKEAGDSYSIMVVDPAGETHTYVNGSTEEHEFFKHVDGQDYITLKALNNGKYKIVYIVKSGDKTYYSNTYSVNVKNVSYELDFAIQEGEDKGLEVLLPTNMKPSADPIDLPVAHVKVVGKDNVDPEKVVNVTITKNGAIQEAKEDGSTAHKLVEGKHQLIVKDAGKYTVEYSYGGGANRPTKTYTINVSEDFVAPTKSDVTLSTPSMPTIELGQTGVTLPRLSISDNVTDNASYNLKSIVITKSNNNAIKYELKNNNYTFDMTKEKFGATSYKDMVGNYDVKYTVVDAYGNEKSITFVVKNVTDSTRPSVYMAYNYELVKDGETITGVKQKEDKDGNMVDDVNLTYESELKSKYGYSEIVLPAIYAKDKVSNYSDFKFVRYIQNTNTKTLYYIDNVKIENGEYVEVKKGDSGYNYSGDENIGDYSKAVKFEFVDAEHIDSVSNYSGEYQLGYYVYSNTVSVQENYVYSSGTSRYSFNVLRRATVGDDATDTSTPEISINNVRNNSTVSSLNKLKVNVTASDVTTEGTETKVNDSRLKNAVFYYYGTKGVDTFVTDLETAVKNVTDNAENASSTAKRYMHVFDDNALVDAMKANYTGFARAEKDEDNANQFVVDYKGYNEEGQVTIVAVTINDYGKVSIDSRKLNITNETETNAPVASITSAGMLGSETAIDDSKVFNQVEDVTLPTVKFTDEDKTLAMSVAYYIDSPMTKSAGLQYLATTGKQFNDNTIVGGTITTSQIGTYYVVYTATDDAGNTSVVYFTFSVKDSSAPILNVDVSSEDKIEKSGNTISGDVGTVITFDPSVFTSDNKTNVTDDETNTKLNVEISDGNKGLDYAPTGDAYTYQFNSEGSYTVKFTATYEGRAAVDKIIYVNIARPELKWDDSEATVVTTAGLGKDVILPDLTASQGKESAVVTVKVTDPDGHTPTAGEAIRAMDNGARVWKFTTNERTKGTYRVTYTATTANGSIEKTFQIKVGDNVAPTFAIDQPQLEQEIVYDGTDIEYKINLNKAKNTFEIVVKNGDTTLYTYSGLKIYDRDDEGSNRVLTSWTNLSVELTGDNVRAGDESGQYFITGAGKCSLKLTMPDSYGNSEPKTITFNVTEKTEPKENKDHIIGTVLIVISLVLLAGVILFFMFTGKKGGNGKKRNKKSKVDVEIENENVNVETKVEDEKKEIEVEDTNKEVEDKTDEN